MFDWLKGLSPTLAPATPIRTVTSVGPVVLPAGHVHRLRLHAGEALLVRQGQVWMTREGDPLDHVLTPARGYVAARPEDVVIESFVRGGSLYECQTWPRHVNFSRVWSQLLTSRLRAMHR